MFNEVEGLSHFFERLEPIRADLNMNSELVIVNDGSADETLAGLIALQKKIKGMRIIDLSRNFGKEAALTCGLAHAQGVAVINLDADLQDSPELILPMLQKWQEGYDMVTIVREDRSTDSFFHRLFVKSFYALINKISNVKITPNVRDYRLMSRVCLNAYLELKERSRFNKGLFAWLGFKEYQIKQALNERVAGKSKWKFTKLFNFAMDGIISFSSTPLRIWSYIGFFTAFLAFLYGIFTVIKTLVLGIHTPGYASILTFILFFSGLNMLSVGILGEYIARVFTEAKQRPLYIVRNVYES
jgi:polyisoprenyl-phosphate glycosyltransferase